MIAKMLLKRVLPSVIALALLVLGGMWLYGYVGVVCSQNEFAACFRRLEQSARTWHTGPTSVNYLANIQPIMQG